MLDNSFPDGPGTRTDRRGMVAAWQRLLVTAATLAFSCVVDAADCDANGTDDRVQIRADASLDRNENGTLDLCELRAGDLDLDERVDFGDVVITLLEMGPSEGSIADLDGDGQVDFLDVAMLLTSFGPSPTSSRPRAMLGDLLAGRSHLDLVVIGDSNATYADGQGSRGFSGGFVDELGARGATMYGTGLFPCAASGTTPAYVKLGATGSGRGPEAAVTVHDASGAGWRRGSPLAPELALGYLSSPALPIQLDGRSLDWAYLAPGATANVAPNEWIALAPAAASGTELHSGVAGAFRVVVAWATSGADTAREPLALSVTEGANVLSASGVPMDGSAGTGIFAWEARYDAKPARGPIQARFAGGAQGTTGPVGMLMRSVYRTDRTPGYAVSVLQAWSGGTSSEIAQSLATATESTNRTLEIWLRELHDRQVSAGGVGRVLVFLNMGVNNGTGDASAPARCPADAESIIASLDRAWNALGFPPDDLGFVVTASHDGGVSRYDPVATNTSLRARLLGDPRVAVVDVNALAPLPFLSDHSLFPGRSSTPNAHLCAEGYRTLVGKVIDRVVRGPAGEGG